MHVDTKLFFIQGVQSRFKMLPSRNEWNFECQDTQRDRSGS